MSATPDPTNAARPDPRTPDGFSASDIAALLLASVAIGVAVSPTMVDVGTPSWVVMAACMLGVVVVVAAATTARVRQTGWG